MDLNVLGRFLRLVRPLEEMYFFLYLYCFFCFFKQQEQDVVVLVGGATLKTIGSTRPSGPKIRPFSARVSARHLSLEEGTPPLARRPCPPLDRPRRHRAVRLGSTTLRPTGTARTLGVTFDDLFTFTDFTCEQRHGPVRPFGTT